MGPTSREANGHPRREPSHDRPLAVLVGRGDFEPDRCGLPVSTRSWLMIIPPAGPGAIESRPSSRAQLPASRGRPIPRFERDSSHFAHITRPGRRRQAGWGTGDIHTAPGLQRFISLLHPAAIFILLEAVNRH